MSEMIVKFNREKELVGQLVGHLQTEVEFVMQGDVEKLEESMPVKQHLINEIIKNRAGSDMDVPEDVAELRALQQELVGLWKKANALNEMSKDLIQQKLSDIDLQLAPFLKNLENGYDKTGQKARLYKSVIKAGV